jgi:hypothetical protein
MPAVVALAVTVTTLVSACTGSATETTVAPSTSPAPTDATFSVEVAGGEGSGRYTPGETVHVWSSVSTVDEVALPWEGDADLLAEPDEWRTTLVMPDRDVRLVAPTAPQELTLVTETFVGATDTPKTVRHALPPDMRGVVLFNHGTGGSSSFIEGDETRPLALALTREGYGVVATEAEEAAGGDADDDGKERWAPGTGPGNVDLANLQILFDDLEARGLVPPGTPKYALGMSAGGAFSHLLGTVAATDSADRFPQLRFEAVVGYCADATGSRSASTSTTPSAWFMCGREDNPEVSNEQAAANEAALRARGVRTRYLENTPTPLPDGRFTRIPGVAPATSAAMVAELRAAGYLDARGFVGTDADEIVAAVFADPASFPTVTSATRARPLLAQLKAVRAEHGMYADATARTIAFFEG